MNLQTTPSTQSRGAAHGVAKAGSSFPYPGLLAGLGMAALLSVSQPALAAATAPSMGSAVGFAVLGATTVTNTGSTVITGDLGLSPGSSITGFPPGSVTGATEQTTAAAASAQTAATSANTSLTGQACDFGPFAPTDLAGQTLVPGVYCYSSSVQNTGTLTLNGTASDVWVFKVGSTFTAGPGSTVVRGAAQSCNVFWQVGSSATLNTTSNVPGTIIATSSITLNTGASVTGRLLALTGAITLDSNTVSLCSLSVPTTTTTAATTTTTAATTTTTATGTTTTTTATTTTTTLAGIRASIPTLSEWSMILLAALLAGVGFVAMRRQEK